MKNWLTIYTDYNKELNQLEILAVGEINGITAKASKKISQEELKKMLGLNI